LGGGQCCPCKLADGIDVDVDFTGWRLRWWVDKRGKNSLCGPGLGRTNILALLREVAQDGLVSIRAVSRCVGEGETVKRVKVACLDSFQPCLFDWEANAFMVKANESPYPG
jgi:hypothetical protein